MQLDLIILLLIVVGLLLYQVVYTSKLKDPEKQRISVIAILVVVLWIVSQLIMHFSKGTP